MSHTAGSYNRLTTYSCYPIEFKHEDKFILFSRLYALWGRQLRTRCDIIELTIIEVPDCYTEAEKDTARDMQIFHN